MIIIKRTLDRELENVVIRDGRILQGNFKLADNGESVLINDITDLNIIIKSAMVATK